MGRGWRLSALQQRRGLQMRCRHLHSLSWSAEGQCLCQLDIIMRMADHALLMVVCRHIQAISLPILRVHSKHIVEVQAEHYRLFAPPLPTPKQAAIERLGMGIVDKLFIRFRPNSSATDGSAAQESLHGRNVLSHQLLWKVIGNLTCGDDLLALI